MRFTTASYRWRRNKVKTVQPAKGRRSEIELLRIFAMVCIVASHYASKSGFEKAGLSGANRLWLQGLSLGGFGDDIFFLISAYFLCEGTVSAKKALRLIVQVTFYTVVLFAVFAGTPVADTAAEGLRHRALRAVFPVAFGTYWFFTDYLIIYLISPFINIVVRCTGRKVLLKLAAFFVVIWSVIPSAVSGMQFGLDRHYLLWFMAVYLTGAWIRQYYVPQKKHRAVAGTVFLVLFCIRLFVLYALDRFESAHGYMPGYEQYIYDANHVLPLFMAVSLFVFVLNLQEFHSPWINRIAGSVFGIYLLHNNEYLRVFMLRNVLKSTKYSDSPFLPVYSLLAVAGIFIFCLLADLLRRMSAEKVTDYCIDKIRGDICYSADLFTKLPSEGRRRQ